MAYWLVKSEPGTWSWDQHAKAGRDAWTGVRNHQAKLHLMAMKKRDRAFFYHSQVGKEIVGIVEVVREAYPDPTAEEGPWVAVDMRAIRPMKTPVTLADMRQDPALADFGLLRLSRLSVVPVSEEHWRHICKLGGVSAA